MWRIACRGVTLETKGGLSPCGVLWYHAVWQLQVFVFPGMLWYAMRKDDFWSGKVVGTCVRLGLSSVPRPSGRGCLSWCAVPDT